jgi:hypothetical protein
VPNPPIVTTKKGHAPIGAAATFRTPGLPPLDPPKPDLTRKISPDATGYYEADPGAPMWNSNRTLHLNQAGHALVGWFRPPPSFVTPTQDYPVFFAVLVASLNPAHKTAKGLFPFYYKTFDTLDGIDPDSVLSPFRPWKRTEPPEDAGVLQGMMEIRPDPDGWDRPDEFFSQRVLVTLTFELPDGTDSPPIRMVHKVPFARASERAIKFQDPSLMRALIVRQRRPIPSTFFDTSKPCGRAWRDARALFDPDPNGPLARQIASYEANKGDGPDNTPGRMIAIDKMTALLSFPWNSTDYATFLSMLLMRDSSRNSLTIGTETKTYREWLASIAANEVTHSRTFPPVFTRFMAGMTMFRCDFAFSALSGGGEFFPCVKGAAGGFKVTIDAFTAPMANDGKMPSDDQFKKVAPNKPAAEFYGAFFELKGGLGDPPSLPEKISFYTSEMLDSSSFDGAYFTIAALDTSAGASVGVSNPVMNPRIGVKSGGDTQLIRVFVNNVVLEGTCADGGIKPKFSTSKGFKMPKGSTLKKIFSSRGTADDSDFFSITKGVKVSAGVSGGVGYIGTQQKFANWMKAAPRSGTAWAEGGDARTLSAGFTVGSAEFTKREENGWSLRFLLETVLATDLALFGGVPNVDVNGYASPEYTPQYNLTLSQKRADAVLQVIDDAVGPLYSDTTTAVGLGDSQDVFTGSDGQQHQLQESDPTGNPADRAKFEKEHQEQVALWPLWRKVEVNIRGHFSVHVVTVGGSEPG